MKKTALKLLTALILSLTGCTSPKISGTGTSSLEPLVCTQWRPISYASHHDTAETVDAIRRANARRKAYCGEG